MNLAEFAKSKGFDADLLAKFGVRADFDRIEVPYYDAAGRELPRFQVRYDGGGAWAWNRANGAVTPYGLNRPVPFDSYVVITEGASDCWALWSAGIPALGVPGATSTGCLSADQVPVPEVVIVPEPDAAGQRFPVRVGRRLRETGFAGVLSVLNLGTYKDPRDALIGESSRFPDFFRGVFEGRVRLAEAKAGTLGPPAVSTGAFLGDHGRDVPYLIDGFLPVGGSMLIAAAKKTGKSVTMLNLAKCVARGEPFLGRATKAGRVLYVSLDEPATITRKRAASLGMTGDDQIDWVNDRRPPTEWVRWLRDLLSKKSYGLIVIDTLAKLLGVDEINSYGEWNRKLAPLHALAEEFTVCWSGAVHTRKDADDEGKGANDVAGSMALTAGVDTIMIERKATGGTRTVETEQRDGADLEATTLIMDENFTISLGPTHAKARESEVDMRVLTALADGPLRSAALLDRCSVRRDRFWNSVERLLREGYITRAGLAGYTLTIRPESVPGSPQQSLLVPNGPASSLEGGGCRFFIGGPGGGACRRCGVAWNEHP